MSNIQIQIPDEQVARLRSLAARRRLPVDELVQRAIDMMLAGETTANREELWERSLTLIGSVHSGTPDLATEHDKYLAEDFN